MDILELGNGNGLQFVKINYLSEKDKLPRVIPRNQYAHNPYRDEVGCCLCVNHIQNKFDFWMLECNLHMK